MRWYRQLQFLKRALQVLLIANVFLIAWGCVALKRFWEIHDSTALELSFVGALTLLIGFVLPGLAFFYLSREMQRLRRKTEERVIGVVVAWLDGVQSGSQEVYQNPLFWTNLGLALLEALTKDINHPAANILHEISPMIRHEIGKRLRPKKSTRLQT